MCKPLSWGVGRKTEREKIKALFYFFARCFSRCPRLQLIERLEEAKGVIEKNPNLRLTMDYEGLLKIEGFRLKKKKKTISEHLFGIKTRLSTFERCKATSEFN